MDADHRTKLLNTLALLPDNMVILEPASGAKYAGLTVSELRELLAASNAAKEVAALFTTDGGCDYCHGYIFAEDAAEVQCYCPISTLRDLT